MIQRRSSEADGSSRQWTIAALLSWTEGYFRDLNISAPRLDAEILLAHALGTERLHLYTEYQKLVEPQERAKFKALVERRAKREPVAYLVGGREFYSLHFSVTPDVLVPRPETEHLVDYVLEHCRAARRILDLGTGSGNIAVSLATNLPEATLTATDIDSESLRVAADNARAHGVDARIEFREGDFLDAVSGDGLYDVIVSNPPYVAATEYETLMDDVRLFEPRRALVDNQSPEGDGLGFYRLLAAGAFERLCPGGTLVVEVGHEQSRPVGELFAAAGGTDVDVRRDLAGIERVVAARNGCRGGNEAAESVKAPRASSNF